jgi:hypothetical protein
MATVETVALIKDEGGEARPGWHRAVYVEPKPADQPTEEQRLKEERSREEWRRLGEEKGIFHVESGEE